MRKLSKLARKALIKASDTFIKFVVLPLIQWAAEDSDRYFFIVIGDRNICDVAWSNTDLLAVDGALAVSNDPDAAAVFEFIETTFDIQMEENLKDDAFNTLFQQHQSPSIEDNGWFSGETAE